VSPTLSTHVETEQRKASNILLPSGCVLEKSELNEQKKMFVDVTLRTTKIMEKQIAEMFIKKLKEVKRA
jgi:hypothetical protein